MSCIMRSCITIFVLIITASNSFCQDTKLIISKLAQQTDSSAQPGSRNAVYLQTNKHIYLSGEDLWFNAFILDEQTFTRSATDRTLYVKLQTAGDSTIWQEMYSINNGVSVGHVYLSQALPQGDYLLKAYTSRSWFSNQPYFYAAAPIKVVKETRDIVSDSHRKEKPAKRTNIQFKIFPEGGTLVAGLQNRVAFKAVDENGNPVETSGDLLADNIPVLSLKTSHAGMGSFLFTLQKQVHYAIKLKNRPDTLFTLPQIQTKGTLMRVLKNDEDSLIFQVTTNHNESKRIFLRLQQRGIVQAIAAGTVKDSLTIKIPVAVSPQGIAEATLFDEQLRPLAERLVYLQPDRNMHIDVTQLKAQYGQKEKVSIKIRTTDETGKPVPATLNLRVYDYLFDNPLNTRNIASYYHLSTQIQGKIYNPAYYFDGSNKDRKEALETLLLTQGWRRYTWNDANLKTASQPIVKDGVQGKIMPTKKGTKEKQPLSLLLFNYNKSISHFLVADDSGAFYISPENLAIGSRFFIKHFSEKEYFIKTENAFDAIHAVEDQQKPESIIEEKSLPKKTELSGATDLLQYGKTLNEVLILAKGRSYGNKYLGYLDSLSKYEGNTDFVGQCGWLNCPACGTGTKPVEGVTYSELTASRKSQVSNHPFSFNSNEMTKVAYHYPEYSEEELLKKFKLSPAKGYYQSREFYEPDYDAADDSTPDNRNTLAWKPALRTDQNGEAVITFFSSNISSQFVGVIEGVTDEGKLGVEKFDFGVR